MAFRRRRRFQRRRRLRPCDIVPLSLCREGVIIPLSNNDGAAGSCADPYKYAFPLVDGGALDAILRNAAQAAGNVGEYYNTEGVTRGLSFLGARFQCLLSLIWDTDETQIASTIVTNFTIWHAICVLPTVFDPTSGNRIPLQIPNLFVKDEATEDVRILHRWQDQLMFWDLSNFGTQGLRTFAKVSNTNDTLIVTGGGGTSAPGLESGSGSGTGLRQHVVRARARLNETHEVAWVFNVATGIQPGASSSDPVLGIDMQGLLKVKGR